MPFKSRMVTFAFQANRAAEASVYNLVELAVPAGVELAIHNILGVNIVSHAIVESGVSLIEANSAALDGTAIFAPPGYSVQTTVMKGTTSTAPPGDAFRVGFDVRLSRPLIVRGGRFLAMIRTAVNQALSASVVAREYSTTGALI